MKVITIEEHIASEEVVMNLLKLQKEYEKINPDQLKNVKEKLFAGGKLTDVENERIPFMNKVGIDMQVLSYINPISEINIPDDIKTENCIKANNYLKSVIDKYPNRFSAFACLPLWDVDASVKELERCVNKLGFKGALVTGKIDGHFLDEKRYFPIFEKASKLDVPIHFHPSIPIKEIQDYYYTSHDGSWSKEIANQFSSAAFGWHLDVGIQIVRLILTGIFDKLPNLKLITGHWGEGIIEMLDRIDYMIPKSMTGFKKNISEYYRENIYVTPSGIESPINLEAVTKYMGTGHIIWAVDYPYIRNETVVSFLTNSNLTKEEKELISHKNAEKLLKI